MLGKSVRTIVDQVDAMKRLVNEFRDYARLPAARLQPTDLNGLIADLMALYSQDVSEAARTVPVVMELDPECPLVMADPQQIRQIVHNLVQNAQDAAEAARKLRSPEVRVRTEWSQTRQRVRLSVCDTGEGFSPTILQRAFEPYVTTKAKGTGLGLAVVKKIADEHGARLELSNLEEGGHPIGAKVSLSFRLDQASGETARPA